MQGLQSPFSSSAVMKPGAKVAVDPMQSFGMGQLPPDSKDLISLHGYKRICAVDLLNCGQPVSG
jgi:hypothetical protein